MKNLTKYSWFFIAALIVGLLAIAIWNKISLDRCTRNYGLQKDRLSEVRHTMKEIGEAVVKSQTVSMRHLSKELKLTGIEENYIPVDYRREPEPVDHPRLVLVFSELSCNVCQDKETQFAIDIASDFGQNHVVAVLHAVEKRYLQNYIRMNQVNFAVYYCDDGDKSFLKNNEIHNTPVLFVIGGNQRIIASHIPIAGHPEYSEPFHKFCNYYFGQFSNEIEVRPEE